MEDFLKDKLPPEELKALEAEMAEDNKIKAAANTMFWIAGLSVANSLLVFGGRSSLFVDGLAITRLFMVFGLQMAADLSTLLSLVIKAAVVLGTITLSGIFVLFGVFARKKQRWAFIAGMVFFALDTIILIALKDWLSFGFHLFMLLSMGAGQQLLHKQQHVNLPTPEDFEAQSLRVHVHWGIAVFGVIVTLFVGVVIVGLINQREPVLAVAMLPLLALCVMQFLEAWSHDEIDREGIRADGKFGMYAMRWDEVKEVRRDRRGGKYVFVGKGKRLVTNYRYVGKGKEAYLDYMEALLRKNRIPVERYAITFAFPKNTRIRKDDLRDI